MPTATAEAPADPRTMRCMEIWGGMSAANQSLDAPGVDAHVWAQPYEGNDAGGDVHYLSMCGSGNIARMLLADVAGHGEAVSDLAGELRTLVRRNINRIDSSRLAKKLNQQFSELSNDGRFATAVVASYFAPTSQLVVVNAGHPRPLWYHAETGQWRLLDDHEVPVDEAGPKNLPLGVIGDTGYRQFAVTLSRDDLIVGYTDALMEAKSPSGEQLGEQGLLELASSIDPTVVEQFGRRLLERVAEHRGGAPADDDVTLIVMHHNAGKPEVSLGDLLGSMAKMMGLGKV